MRKQILKGFINDLLKEKGADCINIRNVLFREIENILASSIDRVGNGG